MPTVILLDVSLSMSRPVPMPDCAEAYQRRHLAVHGINTLLDYCSTHCKLEFMSLVSFSSIWEQVAGFTRDFDSIKTALGKVGDFNKTCIEAALQGVGNLITTEWGVGIPMQVVLITDGSSGSGVGSLRHSLQTLSDRDGSDSEKFPLPYAFACKLHVMVISSPTEDATQASLPLYQRLVDLCGPGGGVYTPDSPLSLKSTQAMFTRLAERQFTPRQATLKCGNLKCGIHIYPAPDKCAKDHDFHSVDVEMSDTIELCGFLDIADVSSPPTISKHLLLPVSTHESSSSGKGEDAEEDVDEAGKTAAFTVLLHGSLKVEGMVALAQLGEDWFGMIYSWADSKKKSNLMLSFFEPGTDVLPWLGNMEQLAPITDFANPPYGEDDNKTPFPVRPADRRSYAQNCVVWIKAAGLQADIQKILRHARKLPEKQLHFYKELNRLRRAAVTLGFSELLDAISSMLERECTMLPGTAHPDAALQLTHAANAIRADTATDVTVSIAPLRTNFTAD